MIATMNMAGKGRFSGFIGLVLPVATPMVVLFIFATFGCAQRAGSAANGGSISRNSIDRVVRSPVPELVEYRPALRKLGMDEDIIVSQLSDIQEKQPHAKLKDILILYLILGVRAETVDQMDQFISNYPSGIGVFAAFATFTSIADSSLRLKRSDAEKRLKKLSRDAH